MDEKVEKEDVTNLKGAITDEVELELDTDELGNKAIKIPFFNFISIVFPSTPGNNDNNNCLFVMSIMINILPYYAGKYDNNDA